MKVGSLSRKEKIDLIKKLAAGEAHVINGEIISGGIVLIQKDGAYYLNGLLVDIEQFKNVPECTLLILPDNGR